jgi:hypothetical protein
VSGSIGVVYRFRVLYQTSNFCCLEIQKNQVGDARKVRLLAGLRAIAKAAARVSAGAAAPGAVAYANSCEQAGTLAPELFTQALRTLASVFILAAGGAPEAPLTSVVTVCPEAHIGQVCDGGCRARKPGRICSRSAQVLTSRAEKLRQRPYRGDSGDLVDVHEFRQAIRAE